MAHCFIVSVISCVFILFDLDSSIASSIPKSPNPQTTASLLQNKKPPCLTKTCILAAASLLNNMDDTLDPCDDFFKFSCGNFLKKEVIPDEKSSLSEFSKIRDELKQNLKLLMEKPLVDGEGVASKMVKNLYTSCMDTDRIDKEGIKPLKSILNELGGWPVVEGNTWSGETNFSWTKSIYQNKKLGYSVDHLVDFSVVIDSKNSSWRIIYIDQPTLGMPSRKYLLKGFNDSDVQAYYNYQVKIAEILGADPERAKTELKETVLFETEIAKLILPKEERRNYTKLYNKMTIAELQQISPSIFWLGYINELLSRPLQVRRDEKVLIAEPKYLKELGPLLNRTSKRTIANYLLWRVVKSSVKHLSEDVRAVQLQYDKKITGKSSREERWKECVGFVSKRLSLAIGKIYVEEFFKEDAKAAADEMVTYVRAAFDDILNTIDWMDNKTRERALKKAKAITPHIAYPKELLVEQNLVDIYDSLSITNDSLLCNVRNVAIYNLNYSIYKLRQKVIKNDWRDYGKAAVVNAYYSSNDNSISFLAGILQGVFFHSENLKSLNYGGIGFVIGHEITHGFDDRGRQFNHNGDLEDWWEPETKEKFLEKAKCIIDQYSNYSVPAIGLNLNGINTQGENIADNGGIKEAYNGYMKWVRDNGEESPLPALPYTPKQLFWIAVGNVWCAKYKAEALKLQVLTGFHSPPEFRVNGPLKNMKDFSKDWNCPIGSGMNPKRKCTVW